LVAELIPPACDAPRLHPRVAWDSPPFREGKLNDSTMFWGIFCNTQKTKCLINCFILKNILEVASFSNFVVFLNMFWCLDLKNAVKARIDPT